MLYVYAQMCLYDNNVCVVYMHVCEGQYVYIYIYTVSMYGQCEHIAYVCHGAVCVCCIMHVCLWEQLLMCISVTVEGSVYFCVLNACISVCGGIVCVVCMSTCIVCGQ